MRFRLSRAFPFLKNGLRYDTLKKNTFAGGIRRYTVGRKAAMRFGGEDRIALRIAHTVENLNELLARPNGFAI